MVDYSFVSFDREWSREHDNNRYERKERVAWRNIKRFFKIKLRIIKSFFNS